MFCVYGVDVTVCGKVSATRCVRKSGNARLTAPRNAHMTYENDIRHGICRSLASAWATGHATVTHVSRLLDHHQPAAESHTSTYASTNRFGGSG